MKNLKRYLILLLISASLAVFYSLDFPSKVFGGETSNYNKGQSQTFLGLTDAPHSYAGQAGKAVIVNASSTGLIFGTGGGGASAFTDLTDTFASYIGLGGQLLRINVAENAIESFVAPYFTNSVDTLLSFAGGSYLQESGGFFTLKAVNQNLTLASDTNKDVSIQAIGTGKMRLSTYGTGAIELNTNEGPGFAALLKTSNLVSSDRNYEFPDKSGTFAMTSDISGGTATTTINGVDGPTFTFNTGTSGSDFNISTSTGNINLNLPTSSASNRGLLSSTDWSTFNGKQTALNGTGFVKTTGTSISYDNSTYVPTAITVAGHPLSSNVDVALDDLSDVTIATPLNDQVLKYNGSGWVNGSTTSVNAGSGVDFFPVDTAIITGPSNDTSINNLSKTPDTSGTVTDSRSIAAASSPLPIENYLYNTPIGGSQIDAGVWSFDIYAMTSAAAGTNLVLVNINQVKVKTGTVTMTGSGTTRTATASAGSTFVSGDASANQGNSSYLQTLGGLFPITAFTSGTVVTITVPSGYVNESAVSLSIWYKLFQVQSSVLGTANSFSSPITAQPAFSLGATDKLGAIYLGSVTSGTHTISYLHDGNSQYTHFNSPLVIRHNDLQGLQGGTSGEYYHLTAAQNTVVGNTSGVNTGNETTTTIGTLINSATSKTTPVDADYLGIMNSAVSNIWYKLSWANIKATLKTYFDTLYATLASPIFTGNLTADTNTLFVDGTNHRVGIGTVTPQLKFVVSNGGAQGLEVNPITPQIAGGVDFLIYNRNTSAYGAMYFDASVYDFNRGNVGINNTNPLYKLDVNGAVSATPITNGVARILTTGSNPPTGYGGGLLFSQQDSGGSFINYASITGSRSDSTANNKVNLSINTGDPDGSIPLASRMTFDTAGNIGINQTNPSRTLDIVRPTVTGSFSDTGFAVTDAVNTTMRLQQSTAESQWSSNVAIGLATGFHATSDLYIDTSGNVKIPTLAGTGSRAVVADANGVMSASSPLGGDFIQLADVTLGSANATLSSGTITTKSYYKVIVILPGVNDTAPQVAIRFNTDTGTNYGYEISTDSGGNRTSYSGLNSQSLIKITPASHPMAGEPFFTTFEVYNYAAGTQKYLIGRNTFSQVNALPTVVDYTGIWENSSALINTIKIITDGTNTLPTGSRIIVYGPKT